jgi:RNA polymerase sigma-70 factor (ECF subfamily)
MAFTTRKSLIAKVRDGNEVSWTEFYNTYKPLVWLCGGDCGLTPEERKELLQNVMMAIFQKDILNKFNFDQIPDDVVFKYDPSRGRFRHYLRGIIRNHAIAIVKKRSPALSIDDPDTPIHVTEDEFDEEFNEKYDKEYRMHIFNQAMVELRNKVSPGTFVAFEMYALQKRKLSEVADFLNMSTEAIYTAKSRCLKQLKAIVKDLEEQ